MEIAFGLAILAILIIGLINRGRQKKDWLKEERHDDSGAWIDKRPGERGAYGSLDAEREAERAAISRESKINELAALVRDHCIEHYPGFHTRSTQQIKAFTASAAKEAGQLIDVIEAMTAGRLPKPPEQAPESDDPQRLALKKKVLDFSYARFPKLLELDIETLRAFDRMCSVYVEKIMVNGEW